MISYSRQQYLAELKAASKSTANHSRRGMSWEAELEAINEYYLLRGIVDIVKNPQGWRYVGEKEYLSAIRRSPGAAARDGNDRPMIRVYSNIDYSGGNGNQAFAFDSKETSQSTFPLKNVDWHQVVRLKRSASCGVMAGLMIKFAQENRVFFVFAKYLEWKFENWSKQTGRTAAKGTASFSISEMEEHAEEISRLAINGLWDWFAVLGN